MGRLLVLTGMTEQYLEDLIQKYAAGTATDEEIKLLTDWYRGTAPANVPWRSTNRNERQQIYSRMLQRLQREVPPKRARVISAVWIRVAALFIVVAGTVFLLIHLQKPAAPSFISVTNSFGKIQTVVLPDGSIVSLNAASTLRYAKNFTENREVVLKGEAFFDVKRDASHPFRIEAGGVHTAVLGTSFNIKAYEEDKRSSVTVITGEVEVSNDAKTLAVLTPSGHFSYDRENKTSVTVKADTTSVLAWKRGKLRFDGWRLDEIARSLERWYGITIRFTNEGMQSCRYYMSFDNNMPLEKLLSAMAELAEMQYVASERTVTLSGKGCNELNL